MSFNEIDIPQIYPTRTIIIYNQRATGRVFEIRRACDCGKQNILNAIAIPALSQTTW
jgi:hypothetical protein